MQSLPIPGVHRRKKQQQEVHKAEQVRLERTRCLFLQRPWLFLPIWPGKVFWFWQLVKETTAETHAESLHTTSGCPEEAKKTIDVHGKEVKKALQALKEVVRKHSQEGAHTFKELLG